MKDEGMKWVIAANVIMITVAGLLLWASYIERNDKARQVASAPQIPTYDYELPIAPQNCDGVSGNVDIALITDANYMDFTRVAILSAKENKCPNTQYRFHVMTLDVSKSDETALKALGGDGVIVKVIPQKEADLFYIRETHVSKTSLLKYYIARELPELDKVLYMDSDILVLHDLTELYNTNIENKYLAAVKDPSWFFQNNHVVELDLDYRGFYFNSGVMLMNLKKFREDGMEAKLEDYTNNTFRTYMDQDALNVLVGNDVVLLPFKNNTMNFFFEHIDFNVMADFYQENWKDLQDMFSKATIIHFASSKKPLGTRVEDIEFFRMLQKRWYYYYRQLPSLI